MTRLVTVAVTGVLLAAEPALHAQRTTSANVLARASAYVTAALTRFTNIVAEEHYVQRVDRFNGQIRDLKADFLLVKVGPRGQWLPFRDVFEVDGLRLRDRESRLVDLFASSSADVLAHARAIDAESYKYNIGSGRTINNPMLGLALLQPSVLPQFTFSLDGSDTIDGDRVDILKFEESGRPTVVHGPGGVDVPSHGRYWVTDSGMVLKTEILLDAKDQQSRVAIMFHPDDRFGCAMPVRMEETYSPSSGARTLGVATYSRFRQFEVKTEEAPKDLPSDTSTPGR